MTVRTAVADEPRRPIRGPVVLAEADVDIRDLLQIVVEGLDLEVVAVDNGVDAIDACRRTRARTLLLDVHMPFLDAPETVRRLRADPDLRGTTVILTTSRASAADVQAGMDAGADTYLIKPIGPIELRGLVEE